MLLSMLKPKAKKPSHSWTSVIVSFHRRTSLSSSFRLLRSIVYLITVLRSCRLHFRDPLWIAVNRIRTLARSPIRLKAFFWPTSRAFTRNRNPVSRTSVIGPIFRFYGKIRTFSIRLGDQKTRLNWQSSRKAVKKILLLHNNFWLIGKIFQIKVFCETPLGGVSSFSGGFFKTFLPLKLKVKVWALMWASKWSKLCHKMLKNCAGKITHLILEPLIKHGGGERES